MSIKIYAIECADFYKEGYSATDIDPILDWIKTSGKESHAFDCKWRYLTVDYSVSPPKASHEPCTCGLQDILDRINT